MLVSQSALKAFAACPVRYRYEKVDRLPRQQSGSLSFGSVIHECVRILEETSDVALACSMFEELWADPTKLEAQLKVDYYVRGTSWKKYNEIGPTLIENWARVLEWDNDTVLIREHPFCVPIGENGNFLTGRIDRLSLRHSPATGGLVVVLGDWKTTRKAPTRAALAEDLQFSAYAFASEHPSFWEDIPDGTDWFTKLAQAPRMGEWVHLVDGKRMDAGERGERHYNRLAMAVDAMAASISAGIFVPNISGSTCEWCDWRALCGLPERA